MKFEDINNTTEFPVIPEKLLLALNKLYPEQSPSVKDSIDEIRFQSGQRDVIRRLNHLYKEQTGKDIVL